VTDELVRLPPQVPLGVDAPLPGRVISREDFHLTDVGNAERLIARHGRDLRYCHPWGRWLVWDGRRWKPDDTGEPERRTKETLRQLLADLAEVDDDKRRQKLLRHVLDSERTPRLRAALETARSEEGVPVVPEALDRNPMLLNVLNGTIHLEVCDLLDHDRAQLITKLAPVRFDHEARAPRWQKFLEQVLPDPTVVAFLRRMVGYSLTGSTREQVLFILYGNGANGKTTLLETLRALLGDYGQQAPAETFLERRETIPNDLARLRGVRFAAAVETPEGRRLNETIVKRMVGGDTIAARFMRGEWFEFAPVFKPWLATNHKPVISGTDEAIWRRIRFIPFTVTIPESERDPDLSAKLRAELPGILNWALAGCQEWQRDGLGTPDAVTAATARYREEMDVLGRFIVDRCVLHPDAKAKAGELYTLYGYWSHANGETEPLTQKAFGQRLADRGLVATRGTGGVRWWNGIGLLHEQGDV
jgi:putative DNA primase/helicase